MILSKASSNNRQAKMYRIKGLLLMEEILNHLRLVVHPIFYRVLYIPVGARFLPSTVCLDWSDCSQKSMADIPVTDSSRSKTARVETPWFVHVKPQGQVSVAMSEGMFLPLFLELATSILKPGRRAQILRLKRFWPDFFFGWGGWVKSGNPKNHSLGYHEIWWRTSCRWLCGMERMCLALGGIISHNSNEKKPRCFLGHYSQAWGWITSKQPHLDQMMVLHLYVVVSNTPPKTNMEPKNWWFAEFSSFSQGASFRFHVSFRGCMFYFHPLGEMIQPSLTISTAAIHEVQHQTWIWRS